VIAVIAVTAAGCTDSSRCETLPVAPPTVSLAGGFVDLTADLGRGDPPFAIDPDGQPTAGVFADIDGDGRAEVLLAPLALSGPDVTPVALFRYDPAARRLTPDGTLGPPDDAHFIGLLDLDGDGRADWVTRSVMRGFEVAWGAAGGFAPREPMATVTAEALAVSAYPDDIDGDGWLDLLVAVPCVSTRCQTMVPLLRVGGRRFERRSEMIEPTVPAWPCAVLSAAFTSDGPTIVEVVGSNPDDPQPAMFFRALARDAAGYPLFRSFDPLGVSPPLTTRAPMAAGAGDLDGDGVFDLVVSLNPELALLIGRSGWGFSRRDTAFRRVCSDHGASMIPWGVALLDLDLDGRLDVVATHGDDSSSRHKAENFIGPQRVLAKWNAGDGRFLDVTAASGLGRLGSWRSLTVGDLDADGAPDLIVGGLGEMPRVYRNAIDNGRRGFALRLRGSTSNHLGAGARVDVYVSEGAAPQHYLAGGVGSPYVTSEPLVFAALGASPAAARVDIRWPSGTLQRLHGVVGGTLHEVVEPPLWTVDPPSRHLPADGRSEARVRVTPRRPDGSLVDAAEVAVRITHGPGRLAGPPVRDAAGWTATVLAPDAPGSTRVEVLVDGVVTPLHPRIWWDPP
jgi:hypothetical protein